MSIVVDIAKRFGKSFRLEVNFRTDGGCLGILGPSGCGKSMTLKCVAGIETPDRGRIVVNGRTVFDREKGINLRPQQRRIGYLFQNYALFPRMTVEQNIGAGVKGTATEQRKAIRELLDRFQLNGMEKRFPDQLSGGQQQRAALARMLAAAPDIILLDEPFSALDTYLRERMQIRLLEILKDYRDAIMVTHSRDEAYKLCSRLLVLDNGAILGEGPTRDLFDNPGHVRVARLTGCKNFSRIAKTSATTALAPDWGLELVAASPIPDSARFVGIRAHDLAPVRDGDADAPNQVRMNIVDRSEEPFERSVLFTNADAPDARGVIWWKYSKYVSQAVPSRLSLPPRALLFLGGDDGED